MILPTAPRAAAAGRAAPYLAAALIVAADAYLYLRNPQDLDRLLINAMLALSAFATLHMRLLSLASAGFAAIGAYASAILAVKLGLPVFLSIPAAALLCGAVALLIGLPVLRLTDVYLAICTLGFGEIVRVAIILLPGLTGGSTGANLSTGFPYETMKQTASWPSRWPSPHSVTCSGRRRSPRPDGRYARYARIPRPRRRWASTSSPTRTWRSSRAP